MYTKAYARGFYITYQKTMHQETYLCTRHALHA